MAVDWSQAPVDPARRLFQVRLALEVLILHREHRDGMEELAVNLEKKMNSKKFTLEKHHGL